MKAFRFIHAADLHLDSPYRGIASLPDRLREQVRSSAFGAVNRLVELAVRERVDFVVIAGDVYDTKDRSLRAQLKFQGALEALAGQGIPAFVIHGNHDPVQGGYTAHLRWPESVVTFGWEEVESVVVKGRDEEPIARVSGISFRTASVTDNLSAGFRNWNDGLYHIGLLHSNVDGDPQHDNYAPCRKQELLQRGVDYWALGHIHTRAILHERPWIVYPGNIQGRHFRETGARGCYLADVSSSGDTSLAFHSLDEVRWIEGSVDISSLSTEQELKEALEDAVETLREDAAGRPALARLRLTGRGPLHAALRREGSAGELAARLREQERLEADAGIVWVDAIEDRTGAPVDRERLNGQPGFLGDLLRLSQEIGADPDEWAGLKEEAFAAVKAQPQLQALLNELNDEELREWLQEAEELVIDMLAGEAEMGMKP
ncbi:DNA repair exonuclease [Paenibacillus filicis]|uniref:DNA repair exonuclease n=1 Tax=Paenibacillus gyeongsangnamensis TaxID=3388067 RepID=A0ABT4Q5G4_9BACL|nr:DNA repair exonuclease [Paenibacillus filicis]MCZ8512127.1 DNA repair exonuclease [Paenibacillus filicis]